MKPIVAAGLVSAVLGLYPPQAAAQADPLLDPVLYGQLERWLGAGLLNLQNIYTWEDGDNSRDFHAAADNRGSTFTLMRVSDMRVGDMRVGDMRVGDMRVGDEGGSWLVGGYNPLSWSSSDGWHESRFDWQRSAFIFNYTDPALYRQVPTTNILPSQGLRQTYNWPDHGPTFGAGPDLLVNDRMDTALSWQLTYGDPDFEGRSIIDGSYGGQYMRLDAMELYAISLVPEPAHLTMLLGGAAALGGLAWLSRRRRPGPLLAGLPTPV
jgi:hypothetical protein